MKCSCKDGTVKTLREQQAKLELPDQRRVDLHVRGQTGEGESNEQMSMTFCHKKKGADLDGVKENVDLTLETFEGLVPELEDGTQEDKRSHRLYAAVSMTSMKKPIKIESSPRCGSRVRTSAGRVGKCWSSTSARTGENPRASAPSCLSQTDRLTHMDGAPAVPSPVLVHEPPELQTDRGQTSGSAYSVRNISRAWMS